MSVEPLKASLIGVGGHGGTIGNAMSASPKIDLVSCYDPAEDVRQAFSEKHGCSESGSFEEILLDERAEAVFIVTPNHLHVEQTLAAAKHGKHIFIEKPIANQIAEARQMIDACEKAGRVLGVAHSNRFYPYSRKLKELVDEGRLGQIVQVEMQLSHAGGMRQTPEMWRWYREKCPGGPLLQLGIHAIDTLHYLFGRVEKVFAFSRESITESEIEDVYSVVLQFESKVLGYVGSSYVSYGAFCHIQGTGGSVHYDAATNTMTMRAGGSKKYEPLVFGGQDAFIVEVEDFADAVQQGREPEVSGSEGLAALAVVDAARRSAQTGRLVEVASVM